MVRARVLAVHAYGVYLEVAGSVLPVLTSDAVALPTSVRVAGRAGEVRWGVSAGDLVDVGAGRVRLPGLEVVACRAWRASRVHRLTAPEAALTSASRVSGANHMQEHVARAPASASRGSCSGRGAEAWLVDGIRHVVSATEPTTAVARLLGRGPGLTPAGDDALAGAVLVGVALRRPTTLPDAVRTRLGATTAVSRALLQAACDGYAAEPVVGLVDAVVAGDRDEVDRHLPRVLAIGHSSGRDLVTGMLVALEAAHPSSGRNAA